MDFLNQTEREEEEVDIEMTGPISPETSDETQAPECFICLESSGALHKTMCRCTNLWAHEKCQKHWMERTGNKTCSVCKVEYTNVTLHHTMTRIPSRYCIFLCFFAFVSTVTYIAAIIDTYKYNERTIICTSFMLSTHFMWTINSFASAWEKLMTFKKKFHAQIHYEPVHIQNSGVQWL